MVDFEIGTDTGVVTVQAEVLMVSASLAARPPGVAANDLVAGGGCSADCLSDETCGNGYADVEAGEACDGSDTGGQDCTDFGYEGGTLVCYSDCTLGTHECRDTITLASDLGTPIFLAVDSTHVYWTDWNSQVDTLGRVVKVLK